jgi:hypothetical protein
MLSDERLKESQLGDSGPNSKWVWGPDLTEEDLKGLVRGGDRNNALPNSGYDQSLGERSIPYPSPPIDIVRYTEAGEPPFLELSPNIMEVPHLEPHQYPLFQLIVPQPGLPDPTPSGFLFPQTKDKQKGKNKATGPTPARQRDNKRQPPPLLPLPPKDYVKLPDPIRYTIPPTQHGMLSLHLYVCIYHRSINP